MPVFYRNEWLPLTHAPPLDILRPRGVPERTAMRRIALVLLLAISARGGSSAPTAAAPETASTTATSASPVASPTQAPCGNPEGGNCLGPLAAGTYTTQVFDPAITYTVPAGWDNEEDLIGNFLLIPPGGNLPGVNGGKSDFVGIYRTVGAPNGCEDGTAPGVATTAAAVTAWIAHDPSLVVTAKHAVRVGGLSGSVMDLVVSPRAKPCPYSNGNPVAPYLIGVGRSGLEHNTGPGQKTRLYLLDHGGDALAIEAVDVHGGRDLDAHSAVTQALSFAK